MENDSGNTTAVNARKAQEAIQRSEVTTLPAEIYYTPGDSRQYLRLPDGRFIRTSSIREFFVGPGEDGQHAVKIEADDQPPVMAGQFDTLKEARAALEEFMAPISTRMGK